MSASEVALAGTSLQRMGGDTSRPSHVYCFGIGLPGSKAGLDSMKAMAPPGWIAHSQSAAAAGAFGPGDREWRVGGDQARRLERARQRVLDDLVDQADAPRVLGTDGAPGEQQVHRVHPAHLAGQQYGRVAAGEEAERHLGP